MIAHVAAKPFSGSFEQQAIELSVECFLNTIPTKSVLCVRAKQMHICMKYTNGNHNICVFYGKNKILKIVLEISLHACYYTDNK